MFVQSRGLWYNISTVFDGEVSRRKVVMPMTTYQIVSIILATAGILISLLALVVQIVNDINAKK